MYVYVCADIRDVCMYMYVCADVRDVCMYVCTVYTPHYTIYQYLIYAYAKLSVELCTADFTEAPAQVVFVKQSVKKICYFNNQLRERVQ